MSSHNAFPYPPNGPRGGYFTPNVNANQNAGLPVFYGGPYPTPYHQPRQRVPPTFPSLGQPPHNQGCNPRYIAPHVPPQQQQQQQPYPYHRMYHPGSSSWGSMGSGSVLHGEKGNVRRGPLEKMNEGGDGNGLSTDPRSAAGGHSKERKSSTLPAITQAPYDDLASLVSQSLHANSTPTTGEQERTDAFNMFEDDAEVFFDFPTDYFLPTVAGTACAAASQSDEQASCALPDINLSRSNQLSRPSLNHTTDTSQRKEEKEQTGKKSKKKAHVPPPDELDLNDSANWGEAERTEWEAEEEAEAGLPMRQGKKAGKKHPHAAVPAPLEPEALAQESEDENYLFWELVATPPTPPPAPRKEDAGHRKRHDAYKSVSAATKQTAREGGGGDHKPAAYAVGPSPSSRGKESHESGLANTDQSMNSSLLDLYGFDFGASQDDNDDNDANSRQHQKRHVERDEAAYVNGHRDVPASDELSPHLADSRKQRRGSNTLTAVDANGRVVIMKKCEETSLDSLLERILAASTSSQNGSPNVSASDRITFAICDSSNGLPDVSDGAIMGRGSRPARKSSKKGDTADEEADPPYGSMFPDNPRAVDAQQRAVREQYRTLCKQHLQKLEADAGAPLDRDTVEAKLRQMIKTPNFNPYAPGRSQKAMKRNVPPPPPLSVEALSAQIMNK